MAVTIGTLGGLWGLLALPVLVGIYFIQPQPTEHETGSLFLWDISDDEVPVAHKLSVFRTNRRFWLQMLTCVLLALVLAQLVVSTIRNRSEVVIAVDTTPSMLAFKSAIANAVQEAVAHFGGEIATHPVLLLPQGEFNQVEGLNRLKTDLFNSPESAVIESIRKLTARVKGGTNVVLITDHQRDLSPAISQISIGSPLHNVGFIGHFIGHDGRFRLLIKNQSIVEQHRSLSVQAGTEQSVPQSVTLAPGELREISGRFPPNTDQALFTLSQDQFALDDVLPLVKPMERTLRIAIDRYAPSGPFLRALALRFDGVVISQPGEPADLIFSLDRTLPDDHASAATTAVRFIASSPVPPMAGGVVTHQHPLTTGLSFDALLSPIDPLAAAIHTPLFRTLVSRSGQPLIGELRHRATQGHRVGDLLLFFDPQQSNLLHLPASSLLLSRYLSTVRRQIPSLARQNEFLFEPFSLPVDETGGEVVLRYQNILTGVSSDERVPAAEALVITPQQAPAFLTIIQSNKTLLQAAVALGDSREGDFKDARSFRYWAVNVDPTAGQTSIVSPDLFLLLALLLIAGLYFLPAGERVRTGVSQPERPLPEALQ